MRKDNFKVLSILNVISNTQTKPYVNLGMLTL